MRPIPKAESDWKANLIPFECGYCGEITSLFHIKFGEHKCKTLIPMDNNFTSHNKDCAATPKLPSLDEILNKCPDWVHAEDIEETYRAIKMLGNFA